MADISQEIDQLRNAVYGEEVRGAFISCMQKIHEENESYDSIKKSVDASAAIVKKQVEAIDTKSAEVQKALQDVANSISNGKKQQTAIEDARKAKYREIASACEETIYAGVDVSTSSGVEHFSLTEKDQLNLFGKKMQLLAGEEKLEYHEDGHPCKYFSAADMQNIVDRAMFFVSYNTTYCNAVNMWIKSAEKASDLEQIQWGAEIPEEFQNEVLKDYMKILASGGIS